MLSDMSARVLGLGCSISVLGPVGLLREGAFSGAKRTVSSLVLVVVVEDAMVMDVMRSDFSSYDWAWFAVAAVVVVGRWRDNKGHLYLRRIYPERIIKTRDTEITLFPFFFFFLGVD